MPKRYVQEHFPSLFILSNSSEAKIYAVEKNKVVLLHQIRHRPDTYSDREGFFGRGGRGYTLSGGEPDVVNQRLEQDANQHYKEVANTANEIWHSQQYRHIAISVPQHDSSVIENELRRHIPEARLYALYGNYVNEQNPNAIRDLFDQAMKPNYE